MPTLVALAGYAALSFLFFLQLPLRGQLPGNTDTLLAIALSNTFVEKVQLLLHGLGTSTSMHPAGAVYAYGENCAGLGFFYMFCRGLAGDDVWGYYLFISTLFALNSFAVFKLASLFTKDSRAALLSGLAILFASFTLANIDDPNVIFVFFPVLAWYFLERGIRERSFPLIRMGCLLSGLQIWFGLYVFVFQAMVLCFFLVRALAGRRIKAGRRELLGGALSFLIPVLPLVGLYVFNARYRDVFSPYDNDYIVKAASLSWQYFLNVLPGNLIYVAARNLHRGANLDVASWYRLRKTCFPGILFSVLACAGLATSFRRILPYIAICAFFLVLSMGANLPFFSELSGLPFGGYLRVPLRFYLFALIPLALFFALGADWALARAKKAPAWAACALLALIGVVYVAENAPFPLEGYAYARLMTPPREYQEFFSKEGPRRIVLDLPSTFRARLPDGAVLWTYNREALYMNWQTRHRQVIVGGVNGYLPTSRVRTQEWIDRLPSEAALAELKRMGVAFIVFHRNLILVPEEDILAELKRSPSLKVALDHGDTTILEVL